MTWNQMLTFRLVLENLLQETRTNLEDIGLNPSTTQYACPDEAHGLTNQDHFALCCGFATTNPQ